ncbi:hypothetical protein J4E90_011040 [Alternaria incomplexa]|uniref:uncharacterized protein n=1 Tax=Alternaria incomplexa TaxID=1187928 RepID=UPI00221EBA2E|nr:uncharacterized protein J4E90_011040 [Alternaria incomplexa]KAI4905965.1 hypothetical protein J4E90_011040 [Alternaria incomplexa]
MTTVNPEIVDTSQAVVKLVDQLISSHETRDDTLDRPIIHISLEGVSLGRSGTTSIITLLLHESPSSQHTYLVDVRTLGAQAFTTAGADGKTLKQILENSDIPKVFFDVRNASAALFALYNIALEEVQDVQLMDSAARKTTAKRISFHRSETLRRDRHAGEILFRAEFGGSPEVFNQRPLPDDIVKYCVGEVACLPVLRNMLWRTRTQKWRDFVRDETERRVAYTHAAGYQSGGTDRVLAPWNDEQNKVLNRFAARDFDDWLEDDEVEEVVE